MNIRRTLTIARRETQELVRDKVRLAFCFIVPAALMVLFGYGLTVDIENVKFAVIDQDKTAYSREYIETFARSRYFDLTLVADSTEQAEHALLDGSVRMYIDIPAGFGRDLKADRVPHLGVFVDGAMPYVGETVYNYVNAMNNALIARMARAAGAPGALLAPPFEIETRFWYNQTTLSKYTFVPALIAMNLLTFSAILVAIAIARERESGTLVNFFMTPLSRMEFLWGKQIPYIGIGIINAVMLWAMTVFFFDVPLKGSFMLFFGGAVCFVLAATALGLVFGALVKSQLAALLVTFIATMIPSFLFSGMLMPVATLEGGAWWTAHLYPTMYFVNVTIGCFTKDLGPDRLLDDIAMLLVFFAAFSAIAWALFPQQED